MNKFLGQPIEELVEKLFMRSGLNHRCITINSHDFIEYLWIVIQPFPMDVFMTWHIAQGALYPMAATTNPVDNPLEDPHVLAKPGPEKFALFILPKPVYSKNLRRIGQVSTHV
jgi:hypothetical protein